ncbi:hypothetical protein HY357_03545 [Candidatus Roizmanbacteria bacterium]|nr:hypothetical protein [Candidatus Roizmanbacteria bacterium]
MINENFVIVGALINLLGGISYIKDTVQGKIKPNKVSWGLWAVPVVIAFSAQVSQGVGIQSLATFTVGFVPFLIFIASFVNKKSYWALSKFDLLCGAFSISGLVLWYITKVGNIAILFSIFADLMAGIPTLVKSYKYPETESWIEFMSSFISVSITMLTFKTWTFVYWGFPLYIFLYDLAAILLIKFKLGKKLSLAKITNKV